MKLRQLLTSSALYGVADMLVLGVGGFLLLPLYTRVLSQAEFGAYVIIRANIEIMGYVVTLGLLSAVSRLYFDYKKTGRAREYLNSILTIFIIISLIYSVVIAVFGNAAWRMLSPTVTSQPYLWYSFAVMAASFTAGLGSLWLRLDNRVTAFVILQIVAAAALAIAAWVNLVVLKLELSGLLTALVVGYVPATVVLLARIGAKLKPTAADATDIRDSIFYGLPLAISYLAFFLLNRFSLLTLQHYVPIAEIAIFGLAQQLSIMITVVSQSFGKAMQPAVFGAEAQDAPQILRRSSRLFIILVFGVASGAIIFASEIIGIVAPRSYRSGLDVLVILLIGAFVYSLSLVSNTTLEYYRRPKISAAVSIFGALASVIMGLLLIPRYHLIGGAVATLTAYLITTATSHFAAYRLTNQSYFGQMAVTLTMLCGLALLATWSGWSGIVLPVAILIKLAVVGACLIVVAALYAPQRLSQMVAMVLRVVSRSS